MKEIIKSWNGRKIRFRKDGFGCLSDMAKATGKRFNNWWQQKSTKDYMVVLSRSTGIPADLLVEINESQGRNEDRGTWAERKVCIRFAQWCSPEFAVQCTLWLEELMTKGSVSIKEETSNHPIGIKEVSIAENVAKINDSLLNSDPRLAQLLKDGITNQYLREQGLFVSSDGTKPSGLMGVVEIAEEILGLPKVSVGDRSKLGKFVKSRHPDKYTMEYRLCNGTQRPICCYDSRDWDIHETIKEFFAQYLEK